LRRVDFGVFGMALDIGVGDASHKRRRSRAGTARLSTKKARGDTCRRRANYTLFSATRKQTDIVGAPTVLLSLKVAEGDFGIAETGVEDAAPVATMAAGATAVFGRPLTFDAAGGIGQGVEAGDRDAVFADLATTVGAILDSYEGMLDIRQLAA